MDTPPLLEVENLSIGIRTREIQLTLTEGISFKIHPGEIYGLVGESGCGKTITAFSILKLLPEPGGVQLDGDIRFEGRSHKELEGDSLFDFRGQTCSMIFQEPGASLNPLMPIKKQLRECFTLHKLKVNDEEILKLLKRVGFPDPTRILNSYPHELSGGMMQRVMIAMALLLKPKLIIADEPTTALDVTVQAQIMNLILELREEHGVSVLLITHNLNLIAQYADRVGVMYAGRLVEEGGVAPFFDDPHHPYTKGLLGALPQYQDGDFQFKSIPGQVPLPRNYPAGCRFADRCNQVKDICTSKPAMKWLDDEHRVSCFLYTEET